MPVTFRRLSSGDWGLLVPADYVLPSDGEDDDLAQANHRPTVGSLVTVTKRDGETQQLTLGEMVFTESFGTVYKIGRPTIRPATPAARPQTQVGNLAGINALFARAQSHLRRPAMVLSVPATQQTLRISVATTTARVPGSLNVTSQDELVMGRRRWFGRVLQNGTFEQREGDPAIAARLQQFAVDPVGVAAEHGRLTGRCCFCNIALTDERSTAVGYGPVCATHYGLPWGERPAEFAGPASTSGEDDGLVFYRQPLISTT